MNIKQLSEQIHQNAKEKGFWDSERNMGEILMLCVSELSEALEADRKNQTILQRGIENLDWWYDTYYTQNPKSQSFYMQVFEDGIKDTFEDEIADTFIRLLDLCYAKNIDIEKHIQMKMQYNKGRERMHGKKY